MKIRAAGFSGTAATTWAGVVLTMNVKSNAGVPYAVTSHSSRSTVRKVKSSAGPVNGKLYSTGPTTRARSKARILDKIAGFYRICIINP